MNNVKRKDLIIPYAAYQIMKQTPSGSKALCEYFELRDILYPQYQSNKFKKSSTDREGSPQAIPNQRVTTYGVIYDDEEEKVEALKEVLNSQASEEQDFIKLKIFLSKINGSVDDVIDYISYNYAVNSSMMDTITPHSTQK